MLGIAGYLRNVKGYTFRLLPRWAATEGRPVAKVRPETVLAVQLYFDDTQGFCPEDESRHRSHLAKTRLSAHWGERDRYVHRFGNRQGRQRHCLQEQSAYSAGMWLPSKFCTTFPTPGQTLSIAF